MISERVRKSELTFEVLHNCVSTWNGSAGLVPLIGCSLNLQVELQVLLLAPQ
jgi:hypothetical protein